MGEQLESIVNVTIHYPAGRPGFWDLLCGNVADVVVHFEELKIPPQFIGKNYDQDGEYDCSSRAGSISCRKDKDALLEQMHREYPAKFSRCLSVPASLASQLPRVIVGVDTILLRSWLAGDCHFKTQNPPMITDQRVYSG